MSKNIYGIIKGSKSSDNTDEHEKYIRKYILRNKLKGAASRNFRKKYYKELAENYVREQQRVAELAAASYRKQKLREAEILAKERTKQIRKQRVKEAQEKSKKISRDIRKKKLAEASRRAKENRNKLLPTPSIEFEGFITKPAEPEIIELNNLNDSPLPDPSIEFEGFIENPVAPEIIELNNLNKKVTRNKKEKVVINKEETIVFDKLVSSFAGYSRGTFFYYGTPSSTLETEELVMKNFSKTLKEYQKETNFADFKNELNKALGNRYYEPVATHLILKIEAQYGPRYISIPMKSALNNMLGVLKSFRDGTYLRRDTTGSDSISEGDIIILDQFAVAFRVKILQNKNYHFSKFFKLMPLPSDYNIKTNNCERIVLTHIFKKINANHKYLDNTGKFNMSLLNYKEFRDLSVGERVLKRQERLVEFLNKNKISFVIVDDFIAKNGHTLSKDLTLPYYCKQSNTKFDIDVTMYYFDYNSYEYVLYVNKNHIAISETKELYFFIDEVGGYLTYDEDNEYLVDFDIYKNAKSRPSILPYSHTPAYYVPEEEKVSVTIPKAPLFRYLFFDFEGVIDFKEKNITRPYSCSAYIIYSKKPFHKININKVMKEKESLKSIRNNAVEEDLLYTHFELGYDCATNLAKIVVDPIIGDVFTYLIGFNSQSYDNFILYNALKEVVDDNVKLGLPFYSGSKMLNFTYNGCVKCFDICRFTQGKLSDVCEAFKITSGKLHFNHYSAQYLYDISPEHLISELSKISGLEEYNNRDVEVLLPLASKLSNGFSKMFTHNEDDETKLLNPMNSKRKRMLFDFMTLPGLMMQTFKAHIKSTKRYPHKKPRTIFASCKKDANKAEFYYDLFAKNKCGGRVQLFGEKPLKVNDAKSPDIKSSYPNVMLTGDYYYPVGDFVEIPQNEINSVVNFNSAGIFFVQCDVDESMLKYKMICKKVGTINRWEHDGIHKDVFICTFQYRELKKRGAVISNLKNCIYYEHTILGTDLFKPMVAFMLQKGEQDKLKAAGDNTYNPALREMSKLCLNSLSGKFIEKLHLSGFYELTENEYLNKEINGEISDSKVIDMNGSKAIMEITSNKRDNLDRMSCIQIGFLIYVYSKHYLYEKIEKLNPYYCDTDSLKVDSKAFDLWEKEAADEIIPHNSKIEKIVPEYKTDKLVNGKLFGSWENEYGKKKTKVNYFLDKKMYLSVFESNDKAPIESTYKMTFKGVGKSAIPIIKQEKVNKKLSKISVYVDKNRLHYLEKDSIVNEAEMLDEEVVNKGNYELKEFELAGMTTNQLNILYSIGKPLRLMPEYVFETLYVEGKMSFITTSLRRSIKNSKRHKSFKGNDLSKTFNEILLGVSVKNIVINNHPKIKKKEISKPKISDEEIKQKESRARIITKMRENSVNFNNEKCIDDSLEKMDIKKDNIYYSNLSLSGTLSVQVLCHDIIYNDGGITTYLQLFPIQRLQKKIIFGGSSFLYNFKKENQDKSETEIRDLILKKSSEILKSKKGTAQDVELVQKYKKLIEELSKEDFVTLESRLTEKSELKFNLR